MNQDTKTVHRNPTEPWAPEGISILRTGETLDGRFVLHEILGHGSSGTVFSALDTTIDQRVAIKVLHSHVRDPRTQERLRREVRASRPGHPNAVTVYDLHEGESHIYLSLELVEGKSLRDLLTIEDDLEIEKVITVGRQIGAALEHLHTRGVVHRDVKPGNILIADDGTAKLCDMGLARPLEEGVTVTETEMVVGTPVYMAPEQAVGELVAASDIYALGLTLYRCLTGEVPLTESSALATLNRRQRHRPPPLRKFRSTCPRWLDRVIRRMLEPRPGDRPSAREVRKAFTRRRLMPRPRRTTVIFTLAALCLLGISVTGAHYAVQRPTETVEVGRKSIVGHDKNGRITWQRDFLIPIAFEERTDLDQDGTDEYILGLMDKDPTTSRTINNAGPEIYVIDHAGREWTHFLPENEVEWRFEYDIELTATTKILDLDHDGRLEVVLVCNHINFFPSVTFVYWPEQGLWDQVMSHPGFLYDISALPDDEDEGLRFLAVNNRLGLLPFVGEIHFLPKPRASRRLDAYHPLVAPPLSDMTNNSRYSFHAYVPFNHPIGTYTLNDIFGYRPEDLQTHTIPELAVLLDEYWNPIDGPNHGRDLRNQRRKFMELPYAFSPQDQPITASGVLKRRNDALDSFETLLIEEPYRVLLDIESAHAMARCGANDEARDILEHTIAAISSADSSYQLAHLEALAGNYDRSIELITSLDAIDWQRSRSGFDGPHLLLRIGIETRRPEEIDAAITEVGTTGLMVGTDIKILTSLRARARLWWDEIQPQDLSVSSLAYAPAGEAIACLARWRQGQTLSSDVASMADFIDRNPDASNEGHLAHAAALIAAGNPTESVVLLSNLHEKLRMPSRINFSTQQLWHLSMALRVVAIEATGDTSQAIKAANEVIDQLTPHLLPRILVEEVLARAEGQ